MKFLCVGKIKRAVGLRGEFFVFIFSKNPDWVQRLETFVLASSSELTDAENSVGSMKLTRTRVRVDSDGINLACKEITDRTQAEALHNQFMYISEELLVAGRGETVYLRELLGFEVFDGDKLVGKIKSFSSNGPQDLLVVGDREIQIPFVQDFISELLFDKKEIRMKLPEGLCELMQPGESEDDESESQK